jgi:HPt (histidine-containing phosphotransfer) domain-containing protein
MIGEASIMMTTRREITRNLEGIYNEFAAATGTHVNDRGPAPSDLSRLNRALRLLSRSNQALIRITDEASLLLEVCRISIDEGGYRMAVVAFAEQDDEKTWRTAAHDLTSVAGTIGAREVQLAAAALEQACASNADDRAIGELLDAVDRALVPVIAGLQALDEFRAVAD